MLIHLFAWILIYLSRLVYELLIRNNWHRLCARLWAVNKLFPQVSQNVVMMLPQLAPLTNP